jgi:hypothetical protein
MLYLAYLSLYYATRPLQCSLFDILDTLMSVSPRAPLGSASVAPHSCLPLPLPASLAFFLNARFLISLCIERITLIPAISET